jgi:hypothetical protein
MRVSITELDAWAQCHKAWSLKYQQKLRLVEATRVSEPMRVGRAVAEAIEHATLLGLSPDVRVDCAYSALIDYDLEPHLLERAEKCIAAVPDWVWEIKAPVSEDKMEVPYAYIEASPRTGEWVPVPPLAGPAHILVGKPDIWFVERNEAGERIAVHVVEVKTGGERSRPKANARLYSYQMFGLQAVRYCVLLHDTYDWLRDLPFYRRYLYLSTGGFAVESDPWPVPPKALDSIRAAMLQQVAEMETSPATRNVGRWCEWCDFNSITTAVLTGGEERDKIDTLFEPRPARD